MSNSLQNKGQRATTDSASRAEMTRQSRDVARHNKHSSQVSTTTTGATTTILLLVLMKHKALSKPCVVSKVRSAQSRKVSSKRWTGHVQGFVEGAIIYITECGPCGMDLHVAG